MECDSHLHHRVSVLRTIFVDLCHIILHFDGCRQCIFRLGFQCDRCPKHCEDRITQIFDHCSLMCNEIRKHTFKKEIEHIRNLLRRQSLGNRGESSEIRHHHRQFPLFAADCRPLRIFQNFIENIIRKILSKHLMKQPVSRL